MEKRENLILKKKIRTKEDYSLSFNWRSDVQNRLTVTAGTAGVWTLKYKVQEERIKIGGGILIKRWPVTAFGFSMQNNDPEQEDYLQVNTTGSAKLRITIEPVQLFHRYYWPKKRVASGIRIKVIEGELKPGDELVVNIGQPHKNLKTAIVNLRSQFGKHEIEDYKLEVYVDAKGKSEFVKLAKTVTCQVIANCPARIIAAADSITGRNGDFRIVVRIEDIYSNLCISYKGALKIISKNISNLPDKIILEEKDHGFVELHGRIINPDLPGRITFIDNQYNIQGQSNPIMSKSIMGKYNLYWGELHGHSNLSHDGHGNINYANLFARDIAKLDFAAITDHTYIWREDHPPSESTEKWWREYWWDKHRQACLRHYRPGKFLPILAQECHPGDGGDHNIFYSSYETSLIMPVKCNSGRSASTGKLKKNYEKLYRQVINNNALIIPHVGGGGKDLRYHNDEAEPLLEIASCHGRFEGFAQIALQRGYRVGFVFGSDFHAGTPCSSGFIFQKGKLGLPRNKSTSDSNGFAVILAEELTSDAVFDAMRKRRCYAVMGQSRIALDFSINGQVMGKEFTTDQYPVLNVSVTGEKAIREISVIRNTSKIYVHHGINISESFTYKDKYLKEGINYYYLRVIQENDDIAWSSPIWVNFQGKGLSNIAPEASWDQEEVYGLDEIAENEAARYEEFVEKNLNKLCPGRFYGLKGVRIVNHSYGRYALLFGYDKKYQNRHVRLMYLLDYETFQIQGAWNWQLFNSLVLPEQIEWGGRCSCPVHRKN